MRATGPKGKRMDMNCHPTTSASSHLLEGVFLGVSVRNRNQKSLKSPTFFDWFRICPGEPVKSIYYASFLRIYYAFLR